MARIVATVDKVANKKQFVADVRQATDLPLSDITARLDTGSPLVDFMLFMNDHEEIARRLRDLIATQEQGNGVFRFFELQPEEDFETCPLEQCEISASVLRNILDSHEATRSRLDEQ
jgi:hypothetical protein